MKEDFTIMLMMLVIVFILGLLAIQAVADCNCTECATIESKPHFQLEPVGAEAEIWWLEWKQ